MIENDKVVVFQGAKDYADFLLNKASTDWTPEFREEFLKGHVVGYIGNKPAVLDSRYDVTQERQRQREAELQRRAPTEPKIQIVKEGEL